MDSLRVRQVVDERIDRGLDIGIQVVAYLKGRKVIDIARGFADRDRQRPVDENTLFPAFSATKAVTAVALHIQAERGLVEYGEPIAKYWPEFAACGKETGTVYDALTHRLGVPCMPLGVTPELMCDWSWMVARIAAMRPVFEPGTRTANMSLTLGWVLGEIVCRTDTKKRTFATFVQEEICEPLGIDSLWLGIPSEAESRVATLTNITDGAGSPAMPQGVLSPLAIPAAVALTEEIWGRPDVRRACIPGAGGIMNSRALARFYAMLAEGGELDGVRLLSEERVRLFPAPRPPVDYDLTLGNSHDGTIAGFHLAPIKTADDPGNDSMRPSGYRRLQIVGYPGFGGQIGWADLGAHLAVAVLRNRMSRHQDHPSLAIGQAIRESLGLQS